jgi:hypothetical protein
MYRRSTNAYPYHLDFQYNNFGDVFSNVNNWPLLVNFSIQKLWEIFISQCSTPLMGIRFCTHIPNLPRDKNKMMLHPCLLEKVVFLVSKTLLSAICTWKKTFSLTLNFMISQMVRNECVKFGRHVERQVKYKIL